MKDSTATWMEEFDRLLWNNLDIHNETGTARLMKTTVKDDLAAFISKVAASEREAGRKEGVREGLNISIGSLELSKFQQKLDSSRRAITFAQEALKSLLK